MGRPSMTDPLEALRRRPGFTWFLSLLLLAAATAGLLVVRADLDKAHVALVYLLIVLAGSAAGGRALGLTLAGLAFLAFDFLFLPPYYTLVVANALDWLVLIAFLATSVVAAELLARSERRASDARERTAEVQRLSALGAETLNAGRPEDALAAIAAVIRAALGVERCEILARDAVGVAEQSGLLAWVAEHGAPAIERLDGTMRVDPGAADWPDLTDARVLVLPLRVRNQTVGVLRMERAGGIALAAPQRQFLSALSYYAALGIERQRFVAEAGRMEALRETDRIKNALLAAVSHDLRTPLTTIKALAHGIGESGAPPGDERADSIMEEADRLAHVVGDLMEFSKISSGAITMRPEVDTAEELLGAVIQRVSGVLRGRTVRVTTPADEMLLLARYDLVHAMRALGNVVENALKYSPPQSSVELAVRREGAMLVFSVADRGPGIPDSERERIFDAFYRPPGVPPDTGGSGLGLTIARSLAEAQGGALRFLPRPGGGSIFELSLPAVEHTPG